MSVVNFRPYEFWKLRNGQFKFRTNPALSQPSFEKPHPVLSFIYFVRSSLNNLNTLTDVIVQSYVDMKVLAVGAKVILYFAFVRTLVVLCDSGDDIAETDSFAFWSTNVLLFYRAAETL